MEEKLRRYKRYKKIFSCVLSVAAVLTALVVYLFFTTYLHTYAVKGTVHVSSEFVYKHLFETKMDQRYYYIKAREAVSESKKIPMIESYTMSFSGTRHVDIFVEEKQPTGALIFAEGAYLYFDEDGYILSTTNELLEGVPIIEGVSIGTPKKYEKLQVSIEGLFEKLIQLIQLLDKYEIEVDSLIYDENQHATLIMGTIKVKLGASTSMEKKISELRDIKVHLEGLKGTLHLEHYDISNQTGNYIFERE